MAHISVPLGVSFYANAALTGRFSVLPPVPAKLSAAAPGTCALAWPVCTPVLRCAHRQRPACVALGTSRRVGNFRRATPGLALPRSLSLPCSRMRREYAGGMLKPRPTSAITLCRRGVQGACPVGSSATNLRWLCSYGKSCQEPGSQDAGGLIRSPWPGVVGQHPLASLTSRAFAHGSLLSSDKRKMRCRIVVG